jgi:hypothetical protein
MPTMWNRGVNQHRGAVLNGWDLLPWFGVERQRFTAPHSLDVVA